MKSVKYIILQHRHTPRNTSAMDVLHTTQHPHPERVAHHAALSPWTCCAPHSTLTLDVLHTTQHPHPKCVAHHTTRSPSICCTPRNTLTLNVLHTTQHPHPGRVPDVYLRPDVVVGDGPEDGQQICSQGFQRLAVCNIRNSNTYKVMWALAVCSIRNSNTYSDVGHSLSAAYANSTLTQWCGALAVCTMRNSKTYTVMWGTRGLHHAQQQHVHSDVGHSLSAPCAIATLTQWCGALAVCTMRNSNTYAVIPTSTSHSWRVPARTSHSWSRKSVLRVASWPLSSSSKLLEPRTLAAAPRSPASGEMVTSRAGLKNGRLHQEKGLPVEQG